MTGLQQRYVALLRGINVGGHGTIRMADLKAHFEAFGVTDVATYIQSGNVLFTAPETDLVDLARALEKHLARAFGYADPVFLFSHRELRSAVANNPFEPERLDAEQACYLMFLSGEPEAGRREALMARQGEEYRFAIAGKVLYYTYAREWAGRRRTIDFEKVLGVAGTARSWKVVAALLELAGAPAASS